MEVRAQMQAPTTQQAVVAARVLPVLTALLVALMVMAARAESSHLEVERIMPVVAVAALMLAAGIPLDQVELAVAALEQNLQTQVQAELQTPAAAGVGLATVALAEMVGLAL